MTLKQAFTMWAMEAKNTVLAAKSRDAVNKVLMKKYNDVELVQFTPSLAERIFRQSKESKELVCKAASILVHILNYGAEKGWCSKPTFTYEIAVPMNKVGNETDILNLREKMQVPDRDIKSMLPCLMEHEPLPLISPLPDDNKPLVRVKPEALARRKAELEARNETKTEKDMKPEEKKPRGKQPKPVAQIDPKTLQVIKVWPSMSEAKKELSLCHVEVAIAKLRKTGGFYWSLAADADTFKDRLDEKQRQADELQKQQTEKRRQEKAAQPIKKIPVISQKPTNDPKSRNAASDALKVFTDQELIDELDRRGWQGDLTRLQRITIGRKEDAQC